MTTEKIIGSVTFPLWVLLLKILIPTLIFVLIQTYSPPGIRYGDIIFVLTALVFCYLMGQYRYARINIYSTHLEQIYIGSFYLKNKYYVFSDIEFTFFKFSTGRYGDPVVFIHFNNGSRKKIFMTKPELEYIRLKLRDLGVVVKTAKNGFDKP